MSKWTHPRYAEVISRYEALKPAQPKRRPGWRRRPYGDGFVIVVDPATLTPYSATHGRPSS
ncbi:hypothetical protein ACFYYH_32810 [Streptomyces sp. NPDC002018]|uniref:hypothetical protein n=1 Tax=Streptomyces sp. NPDC002018 TaxID=3364629 RepID=UPI00369022C7